jgi:beta-mannosidase
MGDGLHPAASATKDWAAHEPAARRSARQVRAPGASVRAVIRTSSFNTGWEFASPAWLDASGKGSKLGFSNLEWLPAQVPGHVHLDLLRQGVIADPFQGRAELGCQWIDEAAWSFRKHFRFSADASLPRQLLRFAGLDTVCRVWLNGEQLAAHDNMFLPLEIELTGRLKDGDNELRIDFESAARVGRERRARFLGEEGLPDDVARFDERAFVRKAQYMFAWDWGPRLTSVGIWRDVSLVEFQARLSDVRVQQKHLPGGEVELRIDSVIDAGEAVGGQKVLHRVEGLATPIADGQSVRLRQPELWWPAGLGAQKLYRVDSFLLPAGASASEAHAVRALDTRSQRIGLRSFRLLREPDAQGESFEFQINGKPLWAVGANWIPDHSFPSIVDRARLRAQLGRALDMNMNMLRIWGGGVYESDDFYELCDELGLLVWQDFPFACSYVPDGDAEQAVLRVEAEANIRRLRNHPSLALWCGNNENLTMWHSKWGRPAPQPPRYYGQPLYDGTLPAAVQQFDPERPYIASSPIGGETANDGDIGDQHYWDVWHGRGDWKYYKDSTARFASEFGFASAPGRAAWRRIFAGDPEGLQRDVRDPIARWHDKTGKGYDTYLGYVELHYPASRDLEEFSYYSQLNQRDALRFGIEHFRRSKGCRGSLIWQLNDCWPVQSWAVLDSEGTYKAAAFELRRLYAPAHISLEYEAGQERAKLWAMLDNATVAVQGEALLEVRRASDGQVLARSSQRVELQPGDRSACLELAIGQFPAADAFLFASFLGTSTFRLLCEPKDARLSVPRLSVSHHSQGLLLQTDRPVIDLFLWDPEDRLELLDNYVTLPSAGQTVLRTRGNFHRLAARSLAGRHPIEM